MFQISLNSAVKFAFIAALLVVSFGAATPAQAAFGSGKGSRPGIVRALQIAKPIVRNVLPAILRGKH